MSIRLGNIYDALDHGDNKGALRIIRNAESRHGPNPILYALKALALIRSDREAEAREACRHFVESRPSEPAVLETALIAFKELGQLDWNREVYEAAVKQRPDDESLLIGLYFAYVREWSFFKQQQTAMRLFRMTGVEKYLRWAAICIELQNGALDTVALLADGDDTPKADPQFARVLALAKGVLEKNSAPGAMTLPYLHQYVRVLRRLGHYEELVKVLRDRDDLDAELQFALAEGLFVENDSLHCAAIVQKLILNRNPNDWRYLRLFMDAHVRISRKFEMNGPMSFLHQIRTRTDRGPWLAELYSKVLWHLDLESSIIEYFQAFGHTKAFFPDIHPYLARLVNVEKTLSQMVITDGGFSEDAVRRRASYEMCWRALRCHASCSDSDLRAKAQSLFNVYTGSLNPNKEKTEFGVGDDLCLLSAFILIDLYDRSGRRSYLLEAAVILTIGLRSSPHNFQFLLVLVRLYAQLGAFIGAFEHYSALDTKSIQLETLTHLVQNDALRHGCISHAVALASSVVSHHQQYERDAPDLVVLCYMKDNLEQALEFTQFRERMRRSFRRAESEQIIHFFTKFLNKEITCETLRMELPLSVKKAELISNDDFTLIVHPDKDRGAALIRSSSFLFESSWHQDSDKSRTATLRFFRSALCLTNAMARCSSADIDLYLPTFEDDLSSIGVVDLTGAVSPDDSFLQQHWRFCLLLFDCSSSLSKAWDATSQTIAGDPVKHVVPKDQWFDFERQVQLIEMLFSELSQALFRLMDSSPDGATSFLATFVNFAARWSVLLLDQGGSHLPIKRNAFDKFCAAKCPARDLEFEGELWLLLSRSLNAIGSLKLAVKYYLKALCERLEASATAPDPAVDFGDFAVIQARDDNEAIQAVSHLVHVSRRTGYDHAHGAVLSCLSTVSNVKIQKQ